MAKNNDYWRKRAEELEAAEHEAAGKLTVEVEREFDLAVKTLDEQIEQRYGRFARNNGISLTQAREWLKGRDLAEFKWDVNEYIKYGNDNALDGLFAKQLENASAKFHISKLEALKIKTRMTCEKLYGNVGEKLTGELGRNYEDWYYHTIYDAQKGVNLGWDISGIDPKKVESVLSKEDGFYISRTEVLPIPGEGTRPVLMQIEPEPSWGPARLLLRLNEDVFKGRTLDELDARVASSKSIVANSLKEAVWHEIGHAKLIAGKSIEDIVSLYDELKPLGLPEISFTAANDGAEAIAEIEVLRRRGDELTKEASDFYDKYVKRS